MIRIRALLLAAAIAAPALAAAPAAAQDAAERAAAVQPNVLTADQRNGYREVFAAIRSGDWLGATTRLDAMPDGPLHAA